MSSPREAWGATSSQGIIYVNGIMRQGLDSNHNYIELMGDTDYDILVYHYNMKPWNFVFDRRYADTITEKLCRKVAFAAVFIVVTLLVAIIFAAIGNGC